MAPIKGFGGRPRRCVTTVATRKAHQVKKTTAQPKLGLSHGLSDGDFSHSHTGFAFSLVIPIHVILHPRHRSGVTRHTAAEYARARLLIQPPHRACRAARDTRAALTHGHALDAYASTIMLRSDATEWKPYLYQGTHPWFRPRPPTPGTKLACPTHTPSHVNQGPELNEGAWPLPPTHCIHPHM